MTAWRQDAGACCHRGEPAARIQHPVAGVDEAVYGTTANQLAADPSGGETSRAEEEHRECGSTSRSDSRFGCLIPRPG